MSGHTPGPWRSDNAIVGWLSGDAPGVAVWGPPDADGGQSPVCMVQPHLSGRYGVAGSQHPIEDARLIAAAPELLDLLKRLLGWDHLATAADGPYWTRALDTAIAKAEGR